MNMKMKLFQIIKMIKNNQNNQNNQNNVPVNIDMPPLT